MFKTANKNLDDALHIYKFIDELPHFKKVWVRKSIVHNYTHAFAIIFKRLYTYFDTRRNFKSFPEQFDTILYVNSKNTYHSLSFLQSKQTLLLEQSNRIFPYTSPLKSTVHNLVSPPWLVFLSLICFPWFAIKYWGKVLKYPNLYFENWGKDYVNKKLLNKFGFIKKVVFANDHNVENRLFKSASEACSIKTVYLQHASVTKLFPKLDFDESYLFGEVDLHKYKKIGDISGEVNLIGSPKFDLIFQDRKERICFTRIRTIGLAINIIDSIDKIYELINLILKKTNYDLIVRLHPGEKRSIKINDDRVNIHHANNIKLPIFFKRIDFLLGGESSIHLEAIYSHTPSSYVNLTENEIIDSYEFIKYNLLVVFDLTYVSNNYIENLALNFTSTEIIKKFIDSYGKENDGKVGEVVKYKIFGF